MKIDAISKLDLVNQQSQAKKMEQYKIELQKAQALNNELKRQINDSSFAQMLKERLDTKEPQLKVSKHAQTRAIERGIDLNDQLMGDIQGAMDKAREKGIKDMVVIAKDGAFVVNVTNNVVVTSMDTREMKNNIFTNIDGAVLI